MSNRLVKQIGNIKARCAISDNHCRLLSPYYVPGTFPGTLCPGEADFTVIDPIHKAEVKAK